MAPMLLINVLLALIVAFSVSTNAQSKYESFPESRSGDYLFHFPGSPECQAECPDKAKAYPFVQEKPELRWINPSADLSQWQCPCIRCGLNGILAEISNAKESSAKLLFDKDFQMEFVGNVSSYIDNFLARCGRSAGVGTENANLVKQFQQFWIRPILNQSIPCVTIVNANADLQPWGGWKVLAIIFMAVSALFFAVILTMVAIFKKKDEF